MSYEKEIKYFSTFSGIGGFELGIANALRKTQAQRTRQESTQGIRGGKSEAPPEGHEGLGGRTTGAHEHTDGFRDRQPHCVGYSEIDKYAVQIYQHHFPDHTNYGDITKIDADTLPDFDLYVGGFPCQAFSIAGKRGGFDDTRGTLFFDVARLLKAKRPQHFILENVKGLLSHDDGRTFKTIITTLVELGYGVEWQVLNSKDFGVPQNRERVIIVGHFGNGCTHQVFPLGEDGESDKGLSRYNANTLRADSGRSGNHSNLIANTLTRRYEAAQATGSYIGESQRDAQIGTLRTHKDGEGFRKVKSGLAPTLNARARQDGSQQGVLIQGMQIRRLTPTECERLQGFPDGWTEGVSDSQRYKTLGNAVTVNVIQAIMEKLL